MNTLHSSEMISRLFEEFQLHLAEIENADPTPEFNFRIAWHQSYEDLLQANDGQLEDVNSIVRRSKATGRALLAGRGGSAKTVLLRRLTRQLLNSGEVALLVDLARWSPADTESWRSSNMLSRIGFIIDKFAAPKMSIAKIKSLPHNLFRTLLLDGLNEVDSNIARELIAALEDFVRFTPRASVIVADRLTRRGLDLSRWNLAAVAPIDSAQISAFLGISLTEFSRYPEAERDLLSLPYFLQSRKQQQLANSSSAAIHMYFANHVSLSEAEIDTLARTAFELYESSMSRAFLLSSLASKVDGSILNRLQSSHEISVRGELAYFSHQLKHDYLVARYVAKRPDLWTTDVLNIITFRASSFDILPMIVQQIVEQPRADHFFEALYDWNLYGAAYGATEGRGNEHEITTISEEMQYVLLSMLAIRRFELMKQTQVKSADAIRIFPRRVADPFLAVESPHELRKLASSFKSDKQWFIEWQLLFTDVAKLISDDLVQRIASSQSIIGWTLANTFRERVLTTKQQSMLLKMLHRNPSPTVRWRAAHALAKSLKKTVLNGLFRALEDQNNWVRYGAVRSIMEIAATSNQLREYAVKRLCKMAAILSQDFLTTREMIASAFIAEDRVPEKWAESIKPLLQEYLLRQTDSDRRDEIERATIEFDLVYGVKNA